MDDNRSVDDCIEDGLSHSGARRTDRSSSTVVRALGLTWLAGLAVLACGCATTKDRGFVQREWSTSLRELGIVPLFPPREDVFVGDVYASKDDPDSAEMRRIFETRWGKLTESEQTKRLRIGMSSRLTRLDINAVALAEYKKTIAVPATTTDYESILGNPAMAAAIENIKQKETAVTTIEKQIEEKKRKADDKTKELTTATDEKKKLDEEVKKAADELEEAKKKGVGVAEAQKKFDELSVRQKEKQAALDKITSEKKLADDEHAKIQADKKADLEKAKKDVADAKVLKDMVSKNLYAQPRDAKFNVFTADPLNPQGADDLPNARINRLRLVGFPQFSTVSFTQSDLSALIPIEAMMLGLNISASTVNRVSVNVPAAESYGISVGGIYEKIADSSKGVPQKIGSSYLCDSILTPLKFLYLSSQPGPNWANPEEPYAYVRVITEVFYARALDVSMFSNRAFGAKLQVSPPQSETETGAPADTDTPQTTFAIDSQATGSPTAAATLKSLEARLGQVQTVPGGTVQFVGYSEQSIGLRRVFDRPIAIGFRGLRLKIDVRTGEIVESSVTGSANPEIVRR